MFILKFAKKTMLSFVAASCVFVQTPTLLAYFYSQLSIPKVVINPQTLDDIKTVLGYDPGTGLPKHILDKLDNTKTVKVIFFSHGYNDGAEERFADAIEKINKHPGGNILPVSLNYQDSPELFNPRGGPLKSYWGQERDALALIAHIMLVWNLLIQKGFTKENIELYFIGHSRGGASILTALKAMFDPEGAKNLWAYFGFDFSSNQNHEKAKEFLLSMTKRIKKVFLANPLLSLHDVLAYHISTFSKIFSNMGAYTARLFLGVFGSYLLNAPSGLTILKELLKNTDIHFYIGLAVLDRVVGNNLDNTLIALMDSYSDKLVVVKNELQHKRVDNALKALRKEIGVDQL